MALALHRSKQFGVKLEATSGTAETLTATDFGLELTELSSSTGVEVLENQVFRASISGTASRIGKLTGEFSIGGEFKNSGTLNTAPKIDTILKMARMVQSTVKTLTVGTLVNQATLVRGISVITGGTSTAKGLFLKLEGSTLSYAVISGTFVAENISSGTFTAVCSAAPATGAGFVYMPSSTVASEKTGTVKVVDGGFLKPLYGAVANLAVELTTDNYPTFTSTIQGVLDDTNWGTSTAEVTGITYETQSPLVVNAANLKVNGTVAPITNSVSFDLGNGLVMIKDLNATNWLKYGVVSTRNSTGSMTVMAIDPATYPIYTSFFAGDLASLEYTIGSGAGKAIEIIMPQIQYQDISESDVDGFLAQTINMKFVGNDNEILIWFR